MAGRWASAHIGQSAPLTIRSHCSGGHHGMHEQYTPEPHGSPSDCPAVRRTGATPEGRHRPEEHALSGLYQVSGYTRSMSAVDVRAARAADAAAMAYVHVESWRETYRGLMADDVLDDPDAVRERERFWYAALTDQRYAENRAAVAEHGGQVVGIAMAGPDADPDADWDERLHLIYVLAAYHGSGAGARLLTAVLDPGASACLWVVDPNPRAQAFYRKHGFRVDGARTVQEGVRELRMTRPRRQGPSLTASRI